MSLMASASVSRRAQLDYAALKSDEDLSEAISLRISKADRELLDALAERLPIKALSIARIALRIGLAEIDRDPSRIFASKTARGKR